MKQPQVRTLYNLIAFHLVLLTLFVLLGCSPKKPNLNTSTKAIQLQAKNRTYLDQVMTISDQRHLLERTGLGAPLHSLIKLKGKTRKQGIQMVVEGLQNKSWNPPPSWVKGVAPSYWARGDMDEPEKQRFNMARDREMGEFRLWWVKEMLETPSPQT